MEISNFSIDLLAILFLVAIIAGFIDTLAGGGGLITLPALMISGIPPLAVLGTNKLQGSFGTATSTYMMLKHKRIHWHDVKLLMLFAFIGSVLGSIVVQFINVAVLSFVIPVVLLLISIYFAFSPMPNNDDSKPRVSIHKYQYGVVPVIGWYDGMFGPGTGSFFSLAGVSLRGHALLKATAIAKPLNFATNIASLFVFIAAGQIVWAFGIVMLFGQMIGAWLGSHCLFKINPIYLRIIVVIMCIGMIIKYIINIE